MLISLQGPSTFSVLLSAQQNKQPTLAYQPLIDLYYLRATAASVLVILCRLKHGHHLRVHLLYIPTNFPVTLRDYLNNTSLALPPPVWVCQGGALRALSVPWIDFHLICSDGWPAQGSLLSAENFLTLARLVQDLVQVHLAAVLPDYRVISLALVMHCALVQEPCPPNLVGEQENHRVRA